MAMQWACDRGGLRTPRQQHKPPQCLAEQQVQQSKGHAAIMWPMGCPTNSQLSTHDRLSGTHRAISADPVAEELYRRLMRLPAGLGRPDAVRRTYRLLARRLADLDADPDPETERAGGRAAASARRLTRVWLA